MVDRLTPSMRSWLMSRIGSKNTKPEMKVRQIVHALGYRYRLHIKSLPGTPDLVFAKRKKVIFVHGCFWHGHEHCKKATLPATRVEYWTEKISGNIVRDSHSLADLTRMGWSVLVLWECELKDRKKLIETLCDFLGTRSSSTNVRKTLDTT